MPEFWDRVATGRPDECWLWLGPTKGNGYGSFRGQYAHRFSWEIANGPIPKGMLIRHSCNNPPCVNPGHLSLGTKKTNAHDMVLARRHPKNKLTPEQVVEIRRRVAAGESQRSVANDYPVGWTMIGEIIRGRSWDWFTQPKEEAA